MNELRTFAVLQARVYEFLEHQDEATLEGIVSGTVRLAVVHADGEEARTASSTAPAGFTMTPSRDPLQAARDLSKLASAHERRIYLNASTMPVDTGLRKVAKLLGVRRYSNLKRDELVTLLAGHAPERVDAQADEQSVPASPAPDPVDGTSETEPRAIPREPRPPAEASSTGTATPDVDGAAIAARLREIETEEEGAAYLHAQHLDRESLLAVAAQLGLTRVDRLRQADLEKRVLKQAIGARRKYAGLRRW